MHGVASVGFTTSIPIEVLLASGRRPVDLNNVFISGAGASRFVLEAERNGFPSTCCAWMKGIYGVLRSLEMEEVIAVVRGDCSQAQALMEVLQMEGVSVYPFAYPYDRSRRAMEEEIRKLRDHFGVREEDVREVKRRLDRIRRKLIELDELTWRENLVSGEENHRYLVASSDMNGDPDGFERGLDGFLLEARERRQGLGGAGEIRLGYLGVPPIWNDFYGKVERDGVRIVYNEVARQFSMPSLAPDLADQYLEFTYPYDVFFRLRDIRREMERRNLDGFIHYTQAFCFRQIEDKIFRRLLPLPILTLEGDRPEPLDGRILTRIEAFLEMLRSRGTRHADTAGGREN